MPEFDRLCWICVCESFFRLVFLCYFAVRGYFGLRRSGGLLMRFLILDWNYDIFLSSLGLGIVKCYRMRGVDQVKFIDCLLGWVILTLSMFNYRQQYWFVGVECIVFLVKDERGYMFNSFEFGFKLVIWFVVQFPFYFGMAR